jgi:hypothetical protein
MHDLPTGSYRTFHDHALLELFNDNFLGRLAKIRAGKPSEENIDKFLEVLRGMLQQETSILGPDDT